MLVRIAEVLPFHIRAKGQSNNQGDEKHPLNSCRRDYVQEADDCNSDNHDEEDHASAEII